PEWGSGGRWFESSRPDTRKGRRDKELRRPFCLGGTKTRPATFRCHYSKAQASSSPRFQRRKHRWPPTQTLIPSRLVVAMQAEARGASAKRSAVPGGRPVKEPRDGRAPPKTASRFPSLRFWLTGQSASHTLVGKRV